MDERRSIWTFIRNAFPINRVVALLTPVAATVGGLCAAWLANHAPLIADQVGGEAGLTAIFIAAAGSIVGMAYKWLDGWAKYEQTTALSDPAMFPLPDDIHPDDTGIDSPEMYLTDGVAEGEDPDTPDYPLPKRADAA